MARSSEKKEKKKICGFPYVLNIQPVNQDNTYENRRKRRERCTDITNQLIECQSDNTKIVVDALLFVNHFTIILASHLNKKPQFKKVVCLDLFLML